MFATALSSDLLAAEPKLASLVQMCKDDLRAVQVWLFGSRARGEHHDDSDWDVMAIVDDETPDNVIDPLNVWRVGNRSGVDTDLIAVKQQEFLESQDAVTTLSHQVAREGVLLYG